MTTAKKAPAKKAPAKKVDMVATVTGANAVDGVAPGGVLAESDPVRLRRLAKSGHVTVTVDGVPLTDGAFVAHLEGI